MKRKRILSILLTACMLLSLIPASVLPVRAFDDPVYNRVSTPEVAILNFYTGNNEAFLKKQISVPIYNAVADLKFILDDGGTTLLTGDNTISKDSTYVWKAFYNSRLAYLSDRYQELQCGFAVTRKSNSHTHRWKLIYSADMTSYMNAYCYLEDRNKNQSWNIAMYRSFTNTTSVGRQGVAKYSSLGYTINGANSRYASINGVDQSGIRKNLYLSFSNSSLYYDGQNRICSCGGTASGAMVSFYDGRVPSIKSVEFRDSAGNPCTNFKNGDVMNIVINCTDAIRFADDSAVGKGSVYIGLMVNGEEERLYAHLTRLDEDSMTFTYKVETAGIQTINGIDLTAAPAKTVDKNATALIHKSADVTLKQIYGGSANKTYSPALPNSNTDPLGFTMTTSPVTDIAGNAFTYVIDWKNFETSDVYLLGEGSRVYLDGQAPFVAKAVVSSDPGNSRDVKSALNKTDMDPSNPDYTDNSDSYLGVGDVFSLTLYMNEAVTYPASSTDPARPADGAVQIATNIRQGSGYLVLNAASAGTVSASDDGVGDQYGLGASNGQVTVFRTDPVTIDASMSVPDGEGIRITGVTFTDTADASANAAANGAISASALTADYRLDTAGAVPSLAAAVQTGGPNADFFVSFTVTDAGSGVQDLPAALTLSCGGRTCKFLYALTFDSATPQNWNEGFMDTAIPFTQTGSQQVLHIRPLSDDTVPFNGESAELIFNLADYAGNRSTVTEPLNGVILDNEAPAAKPGNTTRSYSGSTGTLTACINASDPGGLKKVEVQWSAYTVTDDTQLTGVWADAVGALSDSQGVPLTEAVLTVSADVPAGTDFWQRLWVRATDQAGNTKIHDLGEYRYNLSNIQYALEYPTGISTKLSLYLRSLEGEGKLVLAARKTGSDDCYVLYLDKTTGFGQSYDLLNTYIGGGANTDPVSNWYAAEAPAGGTGTYTLTECVKSLSTYLYGYTGELEITVYSGRGDMITTGTDGDGKHTVTVTGGAAREIIILRRSDEKNTLSDVYDGTKILSMGDSDLAAVTGYVTGYPWRYNDADEVSATLEGRQVQINLGSDKYGWGFKEINWAESFLALYPYNYGEPNNKTLAEMQPFKLCAIGGGQSQTVTLPASDLYQSGTYMVVLVLARNSVPDGFYYAVLANSDNSGNAAVHLDATPAGSLSLGALMRETTEIGGWIEKIPYDPDSVICIPTEGNTVRLMVEALNADGTSIDISYNIGAMDILAWNMAAPDVKISLDGADKNSTTGHRQLNFAAATGDRYDGVLGVTPGEKNVIALQVRWANGRTSAVTYLTVYPVTMSLAGDVAALPAVDESVYGPFSEYTTSGLLTANPGEARIVFTPETGSVTAGLRLFCREGRRYHTPDGDFWQLFDRFNETAGEMTPQSDGTYVYTVPAADAEAYRAAMDAFMDDPDNCPYPDWYTGVLTPDGSGESLMTRENLPAGYYVVYARDAYGNQRVIGITKGAAVPDASAPLVTGDSLTADAGSYTATFTIRDDSLFSFGRDTSWNDRPVSRPMTLTLAYDETYAALIGAQGESLTLTADATEAADASGKTFTWTYTGSNKLGVCEVTAVLTRTGEFKGDDDPDTDTYTYYNGATDACLTVTVKGVVSPLAASGTSMTLKLTAEDAHGNRADPAAVTGSVTGAAPVVTAMQYKQTGTGTDRALYLTFNTPVQPEASWICPDPQGYSTEWHDAFPIWKDGTWTISFSDVFGTRYTQEITLTDVFGAYGIDLGFSTLEPTAEPVVITALADEDGETVVAVGGGTASVNGAYPILRIAGTDEDELTVHISNIVDGVPKLTLYFYLEEFKEQYTAGAADQFRGVTTAPVVVTYATDRQTSPVGENTLTLKNKGDEETVCTFQYYDVPTDETYSFSFSLKDYDITLDAPAELPKDTQAPVVSLVTVWTQRGNGFVQAEAFPGSAGEADVKSAIDNSGFAQSYDFVVNASDWSAWKVTVAAAQPNAMHYSDEGEQIEGVTVQGNNVLVTDLLRQDFWIVVTDNAAAETGAEGDNFTCIKIPYGSYRFDTTPPVIDPLTVADSMYQKSIYLRASDVDDAGTDTGSVTFSGAGIIANTDAAYKDYPWKLTFTDNDTTVAVTATDGAGNSTVQQFRVSGIDVTAPKLSVTWSPCFKDPNTGKLDQNSPAAGPVNTDVVAHITSSKEIFDVTAAYTVGDGKETDYDFAQGAGWGRIEFTSQRVSVFFTDPADDLTVRVTVKAPNGKSTETSFTLNKNVIDKIKPAVVDHMTEQEIRSGYAVPWAETHSLTFSEDVYCMNYGQAGLVYNADRPFTLTMTENGSEVLQFADQAGNLTAITLTAAGLDSAPPVLRLDVPDNTDATNAAVSVTITADEPCTLSCSDPGVTVSTLTQTADAEGNPVWTGTVSAGKNGTFRLIAADSAGNETSVTFTVNNIDRTLPNIHFDSSTVSLRQGSEASELTARLDGGITVWDNVEVLADTLNYDLSQVLLDTPGVYPVTYTVEDAAGNLGQAVRYVKIVDKNLPVIAVDGELTEPNGTTGLYAGTHTLLVSGLKTPDEPYTLQLVKGIRSAGQMKRASGGIAVGEDGSFTLTESGFYTLYIITQSRQTYRTLLYVEN